MAKRPSKYKNQATTLDGIWFHSKREANRYAELKLLEQAGQIENLELQPKFSIEIGGKSWNQCVRCLNFGFTR